jgi:hypothetical protein
VEIGSICISGDEIFVSWQNHNARTFGIDKVDWDNKLDRAYLVSKLIPVYRRAYANYTAYMVAYTSLPTGTSIEMYYSIDYGQNYVQLTMTDDTDRKLVSADLSVEATNLMVKITARTTENDGPVIEAAGVQVS